jgi:hypothetical protein
VLSVRIVTDTCKLRSNKMQSWARSRPAACGRVQAWMLNKSPRAWWALTLSEEPGRWQAKLGWKGACAMANPPVHPELGTCLIPVWQLGVQLACRSHRRH